RSTDLIRFFASGYRMQLEKFRTKGAGRAPAAAAQQGSKSSSWPDSTSRNSDASSFTSSRAGPRPSTAPHSILFQLTPVRTRKKANQAVSAPLQGHVLPARLV